MTRFARAHGSKASNERQPEEATPWSTFKQQLMTQSVPERKHEDCSQGSSISQKEHNIETHWAEFDNDAQSETAVKKKKFNDSLSKTSEEKLYEGLQEANIYESITSKKSKKMKRNELVKVETNIGADAEEESGHEANISESITSKKSKKKKKRDKSVHVETNFAHVEEKSGHEASISESITSKKSKKKRDKSVHVETNFAHVEEKSGHEVNIFVSIISKKTKKKKRDKPTETDINNICGDSEKGTVEKTSKESKQQKVAKKERHLENPVENLGTSEPYKEELGDDIDNKHTKLELKRKRSSLKIQNTSSDCFIDNTTDESASELNCREENKLSEKTKTKLKKEKNKQKKRNEDRCDSFETQQLNNATDNSTSQQASSTSTPEKKSKRQKRNIKNLNKDLPVKNRRRKKLIQSSTVMIDGEEVKLTMFDGFPIRAQDAERLQELRKQLIARGLPPPDISRTLKLERRKSEKALARDKRKVCFHCRIGGHNLSECPQLNNEGVNHDAFGTGICFKCGSTEHTHFQCRVVRAQEYRFAKCFICQEQGHISRQCPDNPRGLYPKGGACRVCGDVTHLKKDCPDLEEEKEKSTVTLSTVRGDKIEALDEVLKTDQQSTTNTPKNKIIKF